MRKLSLKIISIVIMFILIIVFGQIRNVYAFEEKTKEKKIYFT